MNNNEYKGFLRRFIYALDKGTMPPVSEIPIDELELLEVIVPDLLTRMEGDNPAFKTDRAKKVKRNLLAWWDEEDMSVNETPEEVDQYLRDAGYDPDAMVARIRQRMKVAMDASPLNPKSQKSNHDRRNPRQPQLGLGRCNTVQNK